MKSIIANLRRKSKGQSFIELALVFMILMLIFAGVVELGNLINIYLDVIDAARESARNANTYDLYFVDETETPPEMSVGNLVFDEAAKIAWNTLNPACQGILPDRLDGNPPPCDNMRIPFDTATDDIVISVISYDGGGTIVRLPQSESGMWSRFDNYPSRYDDAWILDRLDPSAPDSGIILVEIFYNYHQLLGMPFFTDVLPDPILVHAYSIMPYPLAEPTPTPIP